MSGHLSTGRARRRPLVEFYLVWLGLLAGCLAVWASVALLVAWAWGLL